VGRRGARREESSVKRKKNPIFRTNIMHRILPHLKLA
jgi:hypothetical protein